MTFQIHGALRDYRFAGPPSAVEEWDTFTTVVQNVPVNVWVVDDLVGCHKDGPGEPVGCAVPGAGWFAVRHDALPAVWVHEMGHAVNLGHRPNVPQPGNCHDPCNVMSCRIDVVRGDAENMGLNQAECDSLRTLPLGAC